MADASHITPEIRSLVARLRDERPFYTMRNRRLREHAARELERLAILSANETRDELIAALKGLSNLYASAWDRTYGGLMMMETGVERFDKAHTVAHELLQKLGAA